jgi:hypothetical protein
MTKEAQKNSLCRTRGWYQVAEKHHKDHHARQVVAPIEIPYPPWHRGLCGSSSSSSRRRRRRSGRHCCWSCRLPRPNILTHLLRMARCGILIIGQRRHVRRPQMASSSCLWRCGPPRRERPLRWLPACLPAALLPWISRRINGTIAVPRPRSS